MTSSLLKSIHFLALEQGMVSKGGVTSVPHLPRGTQLGQSGTVCTQQPPPCQTLPHCWPSWGLNTSRTTFGRRHALFTTVLRQTSFLPRLHWDIWSYSGCHLFLKRDRSQNWDPWYAHLSAALVAARHVMWQTKLCTQYYLKFPIKDEQKEVGELGWLFFFFPFRTIRVTLQGLVWEQNRVSSVQFLISMPQMWGLLISSEFNINWIKNSVFFRQHSTNRAAWCRATVLVKDTCCHGALNSRSVGSLCHLAAFWSLSVNVILVNSLNVYLNKVHWFYSELNRVYNTCSLEFNISEIRQWSQDPTLSIWQEKSINS